MGFAFILIVAVAAVLLAGATICRPIAQGDIHIEAGHKVPPIPRNRVVLSFILFVGLPFGALMFVALMMFPLPTPLPLRLGIALSIPFGLVLWWWKCRRLLEIAYSFGELRTAKRIAIAFLYVSALYLGTHEFEYSHGPIPERLFLVVHYLLPSLVYLCVLYNSVELKHLPAPGRTAVLTLMAFVSSFASLMLFGILCFAASIVAYGFELRD